MMTSSPAQMDLVTAIAAEAPQPPAVWSDDELHALAEGLKKFPGEKYPELMRCMKIQASLKGKTVRDIVHRIRTTRVDEEHPSPHSPRSPRQDRPLPISPRRESLRKRALSDAGAASSRSPMVSPVSPPVAHDAGGSPSTSPSPGTSGAVRKRRFSQPPPNVTLLVASQAPTTPDPLSLVPTAPVPPVAKPAAEQQAMATLQENWGLVRAIHDNIAAGRLGDNTELFCRFRHNFDSVVRYTADMVDTSSKLPQFTMRPIAPPGGFHGSQQAGGTAQASGLVAPLFSTDAAQQQQQMQQQQQQQQQQQAMAAAAPEGQVFINPTLLGI